MNKVTRKLVLAMGLLGTIGQVQAGTTVYVPLGSANEILIIDGDQDKVVGRIGDVLNAHGLAGTPDGSYLVAGSMSLAPEDLKRPEGMTADEHKSHHSASNDLDKDSAYGRSYISVIDTNHKRVIRRIEGDGISHHSVITPDGRHAISTHTSAGTVSIIDLDTKEVIRTIATGPMPNFALVSSDGKRIYVSNAGNNTISEIETNQWILRRNITVGTKPEHMVFSPDEQTLYVNNVGDGAVAAVSLTDGKVMKTYPVGKGPHGIDLSDDGGTLFVSSKLENRLTAINLASAETKSITLSPMPYHVTTIKGTGKLYVSSRAEPRIWVLDQESLEVRSEIPIRGEGHQMVVVQR